MVLREKCTHFWEIVYGNVYVSLSACVQRTFVYDGLRCYMNVWLLFCRYNGEVVRKTVKCLVKWFFEAIYYLYIASIARSKFTPAHSWFNKIVVQKKREKKIGTINWLSHWVCCINVSSLLCRTLVHFFSLRSAHFTTIHQLTLSRANALSDGLNRDFCTGGCEGDEKKNTCRITNIFCTHLGCSTTTIHRMWLFYQWHKIFNNEHSLQFA